MGTTSPEFSKALEQDIVAVGGRFIEGPVSGSRIPAEEGSLVAMLAGADDAVNEIKDLISPMCAHAFQCGPVPNALVTKLAVNHFLITMVTGLVEAAHFAQRHNLDLQQFSDIIACGPMASKVSTSKLQKITDADLSVQASLRDVLMNTELIYEAARRAGIASPLLDNCLYLYREADGLGLGGCDMISVLGSLEALTAVNDANARAAAADF
jgi:3-hydroxyisobutyrate dehydrogenase